MADVLPIGTVIYNILEPGVFLNIPENAGKWLELRSDRDIATTELVKLGYWPAGKPIPDGRGVFIRGMNQEQSASIGDPEGNRDIGAWQGDELASHSHSVSAPMNGGGGTFTFPNTAWSRPGTQNWGGVAEATGGKETRSRNIALYTYVKINS